MGSYIKIDRKILEWEWWSDINTHRVFTYMLLKANWKEGNFKGVVVPRGSFVSSLKKLSEETNLTVDEVRTAIKHLKSTNEITSKSHSKFTIFTVKNYDVYQDNPNEIPNSSQPIPTLFPTIEERKEDNIKESITKVIPKKKFVPPTADEVKAYCNERKNNIDAQKFVDFYECKGWMVGKNKMKDWKAAVRTWESKEENKLKNNSKKPKQSFDQREYDHDDLELQLLAGRDKRMKKQKGTT